VGWALALGAVSGWATITRPADAVIFALPSALRWPLNYGSGPRGSGSGRRGCSCSARCRSFHFKSCLTWV